MSKLQLSSEQTPGERTLAEYYQIEVKPNLSKRDINAVFGFLPTIVLPAFTALAPIPKEEKKKQKKAQKKKATGAETEETKRKQSEERDQEHFEKWLKKVNETQPFTMKIHDTHKVETYKDPVRKPDECWTELDRDSIPTNIIAHTEFKICKTNHFTDSQLAQVHHYNKLALDVQQDRLSIFSVIFGFGAGFQFVGASRAAAASDNFDYGYWESPVYDLATGSAHFLRLAYSTPVQLGFQALSIPTQINGEKLIILKQLGEGSFSRVYKGLLGAQSVAIKVLKSGKPASILAREAECLQRLKGSNFIPRVFGFQGSTLVMQLSAPLSKITPATFEQQCIVLRALHYAHSKNYVHWDVRPKNELQNLLGDWGCAKRIGERVAYSGTVHTACDEILDLLATHTNPEVVPHPRHDLISFVRSVFCILLEAKYEQLQKLSVDNVAQIIAFWRTESRGTLWKHLIDLATDGNYDAIQTELRSLFISKTQAYEC